MGKHPKPLESVYRIVERAKHQPTEVKHTQATAAVRLLGHFDRLRQRQLRVKRTHIHMYYHMLANITCRGVYIPAVGCYLSPACR